MRELAFPGWKTGRGMAAAACDDVQRSTIQRLITLGGCMNDQFVHRGILIPT